MRQLHLYNIEELEKEIKFLEEENDKFASENTSLRNQLAEKEIEIEMFIEACTDKSLAAMSEDEKTLSAANTRLVLKNALLQAQLTSAQEEAWDAARSVDPNVHQAITEVRLAQSWETFADWKAYKGKEDGKA